MKQRISGTTREKICPVCIGGVNRPERVHWWCRTFEVTREALRQEEDRIREQQDPGAPSHTFSPRRREEK